MNNINTNYNIDTNQNQILQNHFRINRMTILRKACNKIGFLLLFSEIIVMIVASVMQLLIIATNKYDRTGSTGIDGIPYTLYYIMNDMCEFIAFFVAPIIFCLIFKFRLKDALPMNNNKRYNTLLLVLAGYAICTISNFAIEILNSNLSLFNYKNTTGITLGADTTLEQVVFFISIAIVPALAEEFLFRGVILNYLRKFGDGFAILASAVLFGVFHGNFVQIPFAFIVGLICGFLVVKTGSMLPAIFLHLLNNGTSVVLDIISNYTTNDMYTLISTAIIFLLTLIGFISISILTKKGLSLNFNNTPNGVNELCISDKIISFLTNPGCIVIISLLILNAFFV